MVKVDVYSNFSLSNFFKTSFLVSRMPYLRVILVWKDDKKFPRVVDLITRIFCRPTFYSKEEVSLSQILQLCKM